MTPQWRTAGVAAAMLGLAADGGAASRSPANLYLAQPSWPAYAGSPSVLRDYITAMEMLSAAAGANAGFMQTRSASSPGQAASEAGWTFVSKSGSRITRLPDGRLRISHSDYEKNWFFDTICGVATWPVLTCADGREIRLKVMGARRLSVGDEEFDLVEKNRH